MRFHRTLGLQYSRLVGPLHGCLDYASGHLETSRPVVSRAIHGPHSCFSEHEALTLRKRARRRSIRGVGVEWRFVLSGSLRSRGVSPPHPPRILNERDGRYNVMKQRMKSPSWNRFYESSLARTNYGNVVLLINNVEAEYWNHRCPPLPSKVSLHRVMRPRMYEIKGDVAQEWTRSHEVIALPGISGHNSAGF